MEFSIERAGTLSDADDLSTTFTEGRWWYEAPDKSCYEMRGVDPLFGDAEFVSVRDGRVASQYDFTTNTYRRTALSPPGRHPMGSGPISPTWASMPVGPLGFASVDEALQRLSRGGTTTRLRDETVLGRRAEVYVIERSATALPDGLPVRVRDTYWLEPEPLAILKGVAESSDGGKHTVLATKLEYRRSIDDDIFRLNQPAGALDVSATPPARTTSMGESTVPAPFLTATYLPEGFRWTKSSGSPAISHTQEFRSDGEGYLRIDQRYRHGGWPQNVPIPGTEHPYSAMTVWLLQDGPPIVVVGIRGDIIIHVESAGLSYSQTASVLAGIR
jgi:hypothetical protein